MLPTLPVADSTGGGWQELFTLENSRRILALQIGQAKIIDEVSMKEDAMEADFWFFQKSLL